MIQQVFNAFIHMMLAKFMLNDIMHASGSLGPEGDDNTQQHPTPQYSQYSTSQIQHSMSIIEGVVLGGAPLYIGPVKSKARLMHSIRAMHKDYALAVTEALRLIGARPSEASPRLDSRVYRGKAVELYAISTAPTEIIGGLREKWYTNGGKHLPDGFSLNPVNLAFWFMAAGSVPGTQCWLTLRDLDAASAERLKNALNDLSIESHMWSSPYRGNIIIIGKSTAKEKLRQIVEPYVLPSFGYKLDRLTQR